eukprot:m.973295 g.973295  ORF g.973295 m.973295 type:complete len:73 (-) comp23933_c0_seq17:328-546(-)
MPVASSMRTCVLLRTSSEHHALTGSHGVYIILNDKTLTHDHTLWCANSVEVNRYFIPIQLGTNDVRNTHGCS